MWKESDYGQTIAAFRHVFGLFWQEESEQVAGPRSIGGLKFPFFLTNFGTRTRDGSNPNPARKSRGLQGVKGARPACENGTVTPWQTELSVPLNDSPPYSEDFLLT